MSDKHIGSTFKHAMVYSISGIFAKAIGFIMLPVYAHYLRGEGYGIIGMIDVVISVVVLLIGYGVQGAMSQFYYGKKSEKEKSQLVSTAIILMFVLVNIVSLPVLLLNKYVALLAFGKQGYEFYIILAILTFIADMTSKNAETYILIKQQSVFYAFLSLSRLLMALSSNIYFIVHLNLGVLGYLYSGLIVAIVSTVVMHGYALFHVGFSFIKEDAKEILRYSLPLLPGYVAMFFRTNTDRVLLRAFLGLTQLGVFEMLFKFATLIGFLIVEPFSKIWGVKRFEVADREDGPVIMAKMFTVMLAAMLFFGLVLSVEIPVLLKILTPQEFWLGGWVVALAVLSRIILASYYHFFFGLLYAKKTHKISITQTTTTIINLILAVLLIKPFGIYGAVIVSCLTNTFQCVIALRMAAPYYRIPFEWRRILALVGSAVLLFLMINFVNVNENVKVANWLTGTFTHPLEAFAHFFHLDTLKGGNLLSTSLKNIPLLIEGILKLFLCFLFVVGLIVGNILPRERFISVIKTKSLRPILNF